MDERGRRGRDGLGFALRSGSVVRNTPRAHGPGHAIGGSAVQHAPPARHDRGGAVRPDGSGLTNQAHSVSPSRAYSVANEGRAFRRDASANRCGHSLAGFGMFRDHRISITR